jgi:hypothetical protein
LAARASKTLEKIRGVVAAGYKLLQLVAALPDEISD